MNHVEPITHFLALGAIMLISGFFAVMFAGMAIWGKMEEDMEDPEFEDGEIDGHYYPNEDDHVIF